MKVERGVLPLNAFGRRRTGGLKDLVANPLTPRTGRRRTGGLKVDDTQKVFSLNYCRCVGGLRNELRGGPLVN